ncbi:D(1) dopamine receptor-like [Paramacrobiotus metropolitanus]|uniref:D(1) dopamine receptor-like n=1 Tax=Paramacrobiotus metropolitanus TaxID=2943436 RepID=UPI002445AEB6|nr:D(1) dopamine receptor-like [Paramacrobiotus metropolitanus]
MPNLSYNTLLNRTDVWTNGSRSNDTVTLLPFGWIFSVTIGASTNAGILAMVLFAQRHVSTFNVYLINLLLGNLYHNVPRPLMLLLMTYISSMRRSHTCCTLMLYFQGSSMTVLSLSHLLITINRLWAVFSPYSYRAKHTRRLAIGLCIAVWLSANTSQNAALIMDVLYYREKTPFLTGHCYLHSKSMKELTAVNYTVFWIVPMFGILIGFCAVWYVRRQFLRRIDAMVPSSQMTDAPHSRSEAGTKPSKKTTDRNIYRTYFFMTMWTIVCWLPIAVAQGLATFSPVSQQTAVNVFQVSVLIFYVETIVDPILLLCVNRDWKMRVCRRF